MGGILTEAVVQGALPAQGLLGIGSLLCLYSSFLSLSRGRICVHRIHRPQIG